MSLWLAREPLVLASSSEIRRRILAEAGLSFDVFPAQLDERAIEAQADTGDAKAVAVLLACAKAKAVADTMLDRLVLGVDQTLSLGKRRYSKPVNYAAATEQLRDLRGKTHKLYSALALVRNGDTLFEYAETAQLTMRNFSDRFLQDYLDTAGDGALKSVGAYQLEGLGVHLFEHIDGDYFTILGLPLMPLLVYLRDHGFVSM
jgi:septum formation protein